MKKWLAVICILLVALFFLTDFTSGEQAIDENEYLHVRYAAIQQIDTGEVVYIGMPLTEAEKVLGAENLAERGKTRSVYAVDTWIGYRDDKVCFMRIQGDDSPFTTLFGLSIGDNKDKVVEIFGEFIVDINKEDYCTVHLALSDHTWRVVTWDELRREYSNDLSGWQDRDKTIEGEIIFTFNEEKIITHIDIGDYKYLMTYQ